MKEAEEEEGENVEDTRAKSSREANIKSDSRTLMFIFSLLTPLPHPPLPSSSFPGQNRRFL